VGSTPTIGSKDTNNLKLRLFRAEFC